MVTKSTCLMNEEISNLHYCEFSPFCLKTLFSVSKFWNPLLCSLNIFQTLIWNWLDSHLGADWAILAALFPFSLTNRECPRLFFGSMFCWNILRNWEIFEIFQFLTGWKTNPHHDIPTTNLPFLCFWGDIQ